MTSDSPGETAWNSMSPASPSPMSRQRRGTSTCGSWASSFPPGTLDCASSATCRFLTSPAPSNPTSSASSTPSTGSFPRPNPPASPSPTPPPSASPSTSPISPASSPSSSPTASPRSVSP
ncbi:unnamed protein product [Musa hybrid cultivar]